MSRKDLLKGLMETPDAPAGGTPAPVTPRPQRGAIGAVSQSIADLKARALIEVAPELIDMAGFRDRLDTDPDSIVSLRDSIAEYGQQVPVLLRHSTTTEGRYDVVFGRRRVQALGQLGRPVKAMVRDLNDRDLVVAQGQENSARKDLSFIEKANFAAQMADAGYDRKVICDALSIDKTVISRMLTITDALPRVLIESIGAAPQAGRDRWMTLARKIGQRDLESLIAAAKGPTSDMRFLAVMASVATPGASAGTVRELTGSEGNPLGKARKKQGKTVIELSAESHGFGDWLLDRMTQLHRDWQDESRTR
ncbi:plasmid partitioning protein RepB [Paracoccus sp. JM45]|uniref:plasmid partitioning protein RepB n=1 Tax=Paracoccus sp. JM45 TaxID=2283626 RepID=UPI000E6B560E|nr:plasmid partitioning protein RepB [Paracoccus sp. JM45]RJE78599.1 plasmid partitioning protein RepB [Paracoccus sp. JM45]